ncbi:MAG: hypothetical protein IH948_00010 [Bacteroidetes bacterium]|nr:hypothetical protein [Bacteroidota bacterium]
MVFLDYGRQALAWALGSDITNNHIQMFAIGSGSGTALTADVILIGEKDRTLITGSPNFDTARKVEFQGDFNSVQMSGITLFEFGLVASGVSDVGSLWQREGFGSIVFDGTLELQLISNLEVI